MADSWISLLVQVPLVGVFIWYSLEMSKRMQESQMKFMEALDKRDDAFEKRNQAVIAVINSMNASICAGLDKIQESQEEHDRYVRECEATKKGKRSKDE